jgi:hypothetical protein
MSSDRLEKVLAWMIEQYDTLKGMKERQEYEHYQQMLERAFSYGYLHWENLINSRMGLQASPMTADDLWGYLWQQFNTLQPPPLPQCLVLQDDKGNLSLEEEIQADLHAVSVLVRGEHGHPSHPKADRQWVRVRGKFVGTLALESKPVRRWCANEKIFEPGF